MALHSTLRSASSIPQRIGFLVSALLSTSFLALGADRTAIELDPGPQKITPEEQALAPDAASGSQHGIILLDETERDDSTGSKSQIWHHVRAKIFTNEGRGLADVEIPFNTGLALKKWWGWTILPDGSVRELKQEDLKEQETVRAGRTKFSFLRGALPTVVPGCVIDYGYLLSQRGVYQSIRVQLQEKWPVRSLRYRWIPWEGARSLYRMTRATGMALKVAENRQAVLVTGENLPAVVDEPWMPPPREMAASATFFYSQRSEKPGDFWSWMAIGKTLAAKEFIKERPIKDALASKSFPTGADLFAKLKVVHAWISANVRNSGLRTSEQAEAVADDESSPRTAKEVLAEKKASGHQMDYLFMGFARALGAEAELVLATDRTDHFFDPGLLTSDQFDSSLVLVRAPGDGDDKAVFVDTGSGLPFGELPWWVTGAKGMAVTAKGYRTVLIPPSDPRKNQSETRVSIVFEPADQSALVQWTRTDAGQAGLSERLDMRSMGPEERSKRLQELCGAGGEFEVTKAEAPKLQELSSGLRLTCEGTMTNTNLSAGLSRYTFSLDGFWNEAVPEFTEERRVHAVVFPFPRIDRTFLEVRSPERFTTVTPPAVGPVQSPYGRYTLSISVTPEGYHVERLFALSAIAIRVQEYAPLRRFLTEVHRADQTSLEFRKAGTP